MYPNILSGNITQLKHEAYGKLVVHMQGEQNEIHRALSFLQEQGIIVEGGRTDYGKQVLLDEWGKVIWEATIQTFQMTSISLLISILIALPLGVTLVLTRPGGRVKIKSSILFLIQLRVLQNS